MLRRPQPRPAWFVLGFLVVLLSANVTRAQTANETTGTTGEETTTTTGDGGGGDDDTMSCDLTLCDIEDKLDVHTGLLGATLGIVSLMLLCAVVAGVVYMQRDSAQGGGATGGGPMYAPVPAQARFTAPRGSMVYN